MRSDAYQKFLIIGGERTGTNLVHMYLNSHPSVRCHGEAFHTKFVYLEDGNCPSLKDMAEAVSERDKNPVKFIENRIYRGYDSSISCVGFKALYWQLRMAYIPYQRILCNYLENDKSIKIIHMIRRNVLKTYTSKQIAHATNRWIIHQKQLKSNLRITIDFDKCIRNFKHNVRNRMRLERIFSKHAVLPIYYENLESDLDREMEVVQQFLQLPIQQLNANVFKQEHRPLSEVVINYDEIKMRLSETHWRNAIG